MKEFIIMDTVISIEELFESMPVAMVLVDRNGEHIVLNQTLASISGLQSESLVGRKVAEMSKVSGENISRDFLAFDANESIPDHEVVIGNKTFWVSVRPLRNHSGYAVAEMVVLTDITKTKELEEKLKETNRQLCYLSSYDALTDVLNARAYYEAAEKIFLLAQRTQESFSVLFLDLDHFKKINDTYSHSAGNIVLACVGKCIKDICRDSDLIGRVGGEEFSVFLPETDYKHAFILAEKLRKNIEQLSIKVGEHTLKTTVSIGIASNKEDYESVSDIQRDADNAMYKAKRSGRNRVSGLN